MSRHLKSTTTVFKGSCIVVLLSAYANSPGHAQLQPDPGAENAEAYQAVLDDLESHRIDLNSAAMGNLESLPSLDRTIAIRMVKRRKPFWKYRSLGDLTGISGITTGTLDLLRPYLEIHPKDGLTAGSGCASRNPQEKTQPGWV